MTFINKYNIPQEQNLKESKTYNYDSSLRIVTINDIDFSKVISIYNITINKVLYILGNEDYSGSIQANEVLYTNVVSGVADNDDLYILYRPKEDEDIISPLQNINDELKKLNKSINKIRQ